jgi:hypothetical protein
LDVDACFILFSTLSGFLSDKLCCHLLYMLHHEKFPVHFIHVLVGLDEVGVEGVYRAASLFSANNVGTCTTIIFLIAV